MEMNKLNSWEFFFTEQLEGLRRRLLLEPGNGIMNYKMLRSYQTVDETVKCSATLVSRILSLNAISVLT